MTQVSMIDLSQRELLFAEAIHSSICRQYNLTTNPNMQMIKKYGQTLDIKSQMLTYILSTYFPPQQLFDVYHVAKFLRCVGAVQLNAPIDEFLREPVQDYIVKSKTAQEFNTQKQQKNVTISGVTDMLNESVLIQATNQAQSTQRYMQQLQSQDPSLPFLFTREESSHMKKMLTEFSTQMKQEMEEMQHIQLEPEDATIQIDQFCLSHQKAIEELVAAFNETILAEADLAKNSKMIEIYGMENVRLKQIIQQNEDIISKNVKLFENLNLTDIDKAVEVSFVENSFHAELFQERMTHALSSSGEEDEQENNHIKSSKLSGKYYGSMIDEQITQQKDNDEPVASSVIHDVDRKARQVDNDKILQQEDDDFWNEPETENIEISDTKHEAHEDE
ncbi:Conserved_hypothetical protein [Hexamita inflata]|uniref:Uncharacterized protein n=1 Tax=Hexamita inflata TaxID=28002 RepID=A0AA86R1F9_9EUKA|nr:Conserved hypothetical protein [Hexamita inflata]